MSYFPDRYNYSKSKLKVGLNLSNCARRCVNTSDFTKKADAASWKPTVDKLDKLDIDRNLKPV